MKNTSKLKIIFAAGGTAGHINPALGIADKVRLVFPESTILFLGGENALESRLVPDAGYDFHPIKLLGLSRSISPTGFIHNIKCGYYLLKTGKQIKKIIKDFSPDCVIGTGGYMSYPALKAAHKFGIKTLIHESNSLPGIASKTCSKFCDVVCIDNKSVLKYFKTAKKVIVTGTPLRQLPLYKSKSEVRKLLSIPDNFTILSFGGSLGSKVLTEAVASVIKWEQDKNINHFHAYGRAGKEFFKNCLKFQEVKNPKNLVAREYFNNIYDLYAAADIVISRAGSMTLCELKAFGKPAILVPWSGATENHQFYNAKHQEALGAAVVITDAKLTPQLLTSEVINFYNNPKTLDAMSKNARESAVLDSASKILSEILEDKILIK